MINFLDILYDYTVNKILFDICVLFCTSDFW